MLKSLGRALNHEQSCWKHVNEDWNAWCARVARMQRQTDNRLNMAQVTVALEAMAHSQVTPTLTAPGERPPAAFIA